MAVRSGHKPCYRCLHQTRLLFNLALFLGLTPMSTFAQTIISSATTLLPTPSPSLHSVLSTVGSDAASFALLPSSTSGSTLPSTVDGAPPTTLLPNGSAQSSSSTSNDDDSDDRDDNLLNFYFIFIALFVILLFVAIWFIHRRKKQRKARLRNSGQNALARDLNGWSQPRRWIHGVAPWRTDAPLNTAREEGLNELGEAPPPYIKDTQIRERRLSVGNASAAELPAEPAIPLRTLSRDERDRLKPPDYESSIRDSLTPSNDRSRPGSIFPSPSVEDIRVSHS
jgi:hypothetical protein